MKAFLIRLFNSIVGRYRGELRDANPVDFAEKYFADLLEPETSKEEDKRNAGE